MKPNLAQYETRIVAWADAQPAIRAILIVGSSERHINPADEWSDLDLEIFVTDFSPFIENTEWLEEFGPLWTFLQLQEEGPVFLAVYDSAEKVDFHFYNIAALETFAAEQRLPDATQRGYRIALDKDHVASKLPPIASAKPPIMTKPSPDVFAEEMSRFWYGVLYTAKQIRRRNLWVVKIADSRVKQCLLKMLEWYAQSQHDWAIDTWHDGHFLSQWCDPDTFQEVEHSFGHFDVPDSWQALFSTITLFRRLSYTLAEHLDYFYPAQLDNNCTEYIHALHLEDNRAR